MLKRLPCSSPLCNQSSRGSKEFVLLVSNLSQAGMNPVHHSVYEYVLQSESVGMRNFLVRSVNTHKSRFIWEFHEIIADLGITRNYKTMEAGICAMTDHYLLHQNQMRFREL